MQEMFPPEIRQLMEEAVSNEIRHYHQCKRDALREHTADAERKKILWSNAFSEGEIRIYLNEYERCAQRVLDSIKSIHFTPFPNCEKELIAISTLALHQLIATEPSGFSKVSKKFAIPVYQSRTKHALKRLETELKIYVNQLRSKIPTVPSPQVTVVGDNNNIQTGNENIVRTRIPVRPEKPHWTVTPMFWLTLLIFVAGAIVAIPIILGWIHRNAQEPEQHGDHSSIQGEGGNSAVAAASLPKETEIHQPEWEPPELPSGCKWVTVSFGGAKAGNPTSITNWNISDLSGASINCNISNNRFFINANISWNGVDNYSISNLTFAGTMPGDWDRNYDTNAFEIVGPDGQVIFQEIYSLPEHVIVNGLFPGPQPGLMLGAFGSDIMIAPVGKILAKMTNRTPVFKYPSWKFPHELAGN
jgi:hypothetical protein